MENCLILNNHDWIPGSASRSQAIELPFVILETVEKHVLAQRWIENTQ